jgi:Peptidase inhibitor family I36
VIRPGHALSALHLTASFSLSQVVHVLSPRRDGGQQSNRNEGGHVRIKSLGAGLVAALLMGLGLAAVQVQTATAANRDGICQSGEICLWQAVDYRGGRDDFYYAEDNYLGLVFIAACSSNCSLNDQVSSLQNRDAGKYIRFYTAATGTGYRFQRAPYGTYGSAAQNLTLDKDPDGVPYNDRFSSHCFVYSADPSWC